MNCKVIWCCLGNKTRVRICETRDYNFNLCDSKMEVYSLGIIQVPVLTVVAVVQACGELTWNMRMTSTSQI